MNRRALLLILVTILVAAAAVPALGAGTETVTPTFDTKASVRALAKARLALLTARSAKSESRRSVRTAESAQIAAADAKAKAAATQAALDATHVQSAIASGSVSTESESYVQLAGGPSVTLTAPSSGLIEIWAQVTFSGEGSTALFEDGQLLAGQSEFCAPEEEGRALLSAFETGGGPPVTVSTPSSLAFGGFGGPIICGTFGPPAPVLFQTTPGSHTYELRYKAAPPCGCPGSEPEVTVSNRRLFVGPRL
jgi:hypothetical protein